MFNRNNNILKGMPNIPLEELLHTFKRWYWEREGLLSELKQATESGEKASIQNKIDEILSNLNERERIILNCFNLKRSTKTKNAFNDYCNNEINYIGFAQRLLGGV